MAATTLDGTIKSTFHGNRLLLTGTLTEDHNFTNVNHHLGLVSVDAFENQAKADNQYADNETWPVASASPVMKGSVTLMQMDDKLRTDFFGQSTVNANVGSVPVSGFADTGVYPQRALMYVTDGIAKDADGKESKLDMPDTSNVLQWFCENGTKVSVRPSGTEPKIKFYIEVKDVMTDASQYDELDKKGAERVERISKQLGL